MKSYLSFFILLTIGFVFPGYAEYRAHLMEVYDLIDGTKQNVITGFSPDKYIATHGGDQRISVLVKATWLCYGDTSNFEKICPMPKPRRPRFKIGDRIQINLHKHITDGWKGVIEIALYREDLKYNIYGVRFPNHRNLYGRYYEFNLKLINQPPSPPTPATTSP